ncbi:DUF1722 domain-containing protein [Affinibrenneria salicis]|uniref:DUF1722 domain-containing protein n=1 Tax=Affinibrenneria salicis TaxID=2590031 RepID=A0A5J5G0T3_9GAMM|nr:DUF1722 domain-containing protein [Affinibrenneria salicis]
MLLKRQRRTEPMTQYSIPLGIVNSETMPALAADGALWPGCFVGRPITRDGADDAALRDLCGLLVADGAEETAALCELRCPWLPRLDAAEWGDEAACRHFIARVCALYEFNLLCRQTLSRGALMAFHSRYKLVLLAHSQPEYRTLGPFVGAMAQRPSLDDYAQEYRLRLMSLMAHRTTRRNHTNVLMHVQGYFRPQLSSEQRQELTRTIDDYRRGLQPRAAPMALLRGYMALYPDPWLAQQRYFHPFLEQSA